MTKKVDIPISMLADPPHVLERFCELVRGGMAPMLATIVASQCCPAAATDKARMIGVPPLEESCGKEYARLRKAEARAAGISISDNSRYNPTMADSRAGADPKAWTHAGDGISTMKRRLRDIGGGSDDLGVPVDLARTAESMAKKKQKFIALQKRKYEQRAVKLEQMRRCGSH